TTPIDEAQPGPSLMSVPRQAESSCLAEYPGFASGLGRRPHVDPEHVALPRTECQADPNRTMLLTHGVSHDTQDPQYCEENRQRSQCPQLATYRSM
ncbi:MAG: hypothetical protein ACYTDV_15810, partial [Planctomycetota bacterium]